MADFVLKYAKLYTIFVFDVVTCHKSRNASHPIIFGVCVKSLFPLKRNTQEDTGSADFIQWLKRENNESITQNIPNNARPHHPT